MNGYIYKITNIITGKSYIGKTHLTPSKRFEKHIRDAFYKDENGWKNDWHFCRGIRKYGAESFVVEKLETSPIGVLSKREQFFIEQFDTYKNGYNSTKGGEGTHGRVLSEETKRKIGDGNRGKKFSDETRRKLSFAHTGKTVSEQTKTKIKRNASKHWLGKKLPKETRNKISEKLKGKPAWNKGKHFGDESKSKMKESRKKMIERFTTKWIVTADTKEVRPTDNKRFTYFIYCYCDVCKFQRKVQKHKYSERMFCPNCAKFVDG